MIYHIQEFGKAGAFSCSELDMVSSEVQKVEKWKEQCVEILGILVDDGHPLLGALQKVLIKDYVNFYF